MPEGKCRITLLPTSEESAASLLPTVILGLDPRIHASPHTETAKDPDAGDIRVFGEVSDGTA